MIEDILRALVGLAPGASRINKDIAIMRQITRPLAEELIPWEEEKEIELMSMNLEVKTHKRGMDRILYGTLRSIYFEPMVAFAYMDYVKGAREALMYCRTRGLELIYRIKKRDTDVYLNGSQVAVLDMQNILHGLRSRSVIGQIKPYSPDLLSIIIWDREAGHLYNPSRPHSDVQRAFFLMTPLSDEEERIFMALGFYELLFRLLANKKQK